MAVDMLEEKEFLQGLTAELKKAADKLWERLVYHSDAYRENARYSWEHRSDFDGYEMLFNRLDIERLVDAGENTKEQFHRILKMLDSPYFARINFTQKGETEPLKVYIGKFSFWDIKSEYEVFDWRAPIASVYYEFEHGAAWYDAPTGRVEGTVDCKRQYRIVQGILEYALESDLSISDEILQKELSQTSDHKMKDIVTTIQKEQNRLIRDELADVLIVQGVAGSGKTSVALHRIAYFLYRYRNEVSSENFLIISPNGIFVDYISGVLPELGEENIRSIGMEDVAKVCLPKELRRERLCGLPEQFLMSQDKAWLERSAFKATTEFLHQLDAYLRYCDEHLFTAEDYPYEGGVIKADFIQRYYAKQTAFPVLFRLQETAQAMMEEMKALKAKGYGTHKKEVLEWMQERLSCRDAISLYQGFWQHIGKEALFIWEEGGELESADIFPLLHVKLYLDGGPKNENIKYLLIDEMQDYVPIQYAVINKLYSCRKTILGDISQNVMPFVENTLDFLKEMYPAAEVIEMNKSYRSTCEIMEFAQEIRRNISIEPVQRHGEEPVLVKCRDSEEEREKLLQLLAGDEDSRKKEKIGVICKTGVQAKELYEWILEQSQNKERFHLLDYDSEEFYDGVMVTSVAMSKGLEFDEVVIPDVDDSNYSSEYDRGLLYVACTRAMHRLTLLHGKNASRLIDKLL